MGRSRAAPAHSDDSNQSRSKRKRTISNVENLQTTIAGPGMNQGKKALYHCNYCNKDISGMIRIKCARCQDFDLCVECFSVGAEVTPHKSNHSYRVMDNLSFPLICPDWNLDEEMLLLEGIGMYGFGNWTEVSEHVGTKSKSQCIDHYNTVYMNSPCFPLPDLSHVTGKSREELLAMAKGHSEVKKELPMLGTLSLKEESPVSAKVKSEEPHKGPAYKSSSSVTAEIGSRAGTSGGKTFPGALKKASNTVQIKDPVKVEESQSERRIGEKKPRTSGEEGPSMMELSGYNVKRHEFEIEYDNDAEHLLADMEFRDTDIDAEREMKLRVLRIYSKRLDERKRRKDFILERNLLHPDPFEKNLSPEEREICQRYKVFMRFHSKEEHEELLKSVIEEYHIVKRIKELQEARAVGCRTAAEAKCFFERKRKEAEENVVGLKESNLAGSSGKAPQRLNSHGREIDGSPRGVRSVQPGATESSSTIVGHAISRPLDDWDITGCIGEDLLSETEKQLCCEMRILPAHYLNMLQTMSVETMKGNITKRSDAHNLFKVDPSKVDKVYDMLIKKGIAQA